MDFLAKAAPLALPQDLGTGDTPEFAGLTIGSSDGVDVNPGSDTDADLLTVGVTGGPVMMWDESADKFSFNKGIGVTDGEVQIQTNNSTDAIRTREIANRVGIFTNNPQARFHVDQFSATGAIPALILGQTDVDIVLMKIIATAQAASADRTLVADSDYGTPGALVGWIQVEIQDDGNRVADGDYYIPFYAAPT